jgi:hypothetical protein
MEELRVTNLLGGALAAISGAVVASFFGVFGTLAGAGVMSIFADPLAADRGRCGGRIRDRDGSSHHGGGGRRAAAREPAWKPAAARGEHVGGCDRGTVGCTGAPGSGHLRYVAAGVGAHDHGAGWCCTNDRAGGDRPQHHGSQRHRLDHDHP